MRADSELYEREHIERALQERGYTVHSNPGGKRIAEVDVVQDDVFVERDLVLPIVLPELAPTWPNVFHWLTEEDVIRRELRFAEGERYDSARVEESMRNLRGLGVFSLVRIVAVGTADPDAVRVVVYTRDLWSLRAETAFAGTGSAFSGSLTLIERNLFGERKQVALTGSIGPKTFSVGEGYSDYRLFGEELSLSESFSLIFNRDSGKSEGSGGSIGLGRPFYNLDQPWAWSIGASYSVFVARSLLGGEVIGFVPSPTSAPPTPCALSEPGCLAGVWDDRSAGVDASATYRRGVRYKQAFTLGWGFSDRSVRPNDETALAPGDEPAFREQILPRARRQVYPYLQYGLGLPQYEVFENLGTFGQSENVNTGPALSAGFGFPLRGFGSSTDSVSFGGGLGYTLADGHALAGASVAAGARLEEGRVVDQRIGGGVSGATPTWLVGRLVARASWTGRRNDTSNAQIVLGGDNGLRGYASGRFRVIGGSAMLGNIEARTLPLDILSVHLGAVLFYDVGSVYAKLDEARFHHGAGAGLRVLFPQVNRDVFRFDVGVPLDQDGFSVLFSYGSEQMF